MSETATTATELASQYAAQVTGDLESNTKEQERLSAEITSLQEQLAALQRDHSVLVNIQQALGSTWAPAEEAAAPVPAPRRKSAPAEGTAGKRTGAKKSAAQQGKTEKKAAAGKSAAKQPAAKSVAKPAAKPVAKSAAKKPAAPTLGELIAGVLAEQKEPRSAAEVATALGEAHADRPVKTTVVRNTLENLVAKNQVQRSKQGSSVFYTVSEAAQASAPADEAPAGQGE